MKIAVVTLHRVYNYGSALQAYATQCIFEQMGHEVRIVDYITEQRTKKRIFFLDSKAGALQGVRGLVYRGAKLFSILLKELTFGSFVRKNLKLTPQYIADTDLDYNPPKADVYVTGSDQTWNSDYNEGIDRGFFLDFLPENARRISFVASFGKNELSADEIEQTRKYISRYCALSVREEQACKILAALGRNDAVQLIDPTLQISKDAWGALASKRLVKKSYLILMLLYNEDNHATEFARKIADEKGLKLVKISWEMLKPPMVDQLFTHRSPSDFLSLFQHADFVVTNSFHGVAFSINFEKQFIVVPRNEFNSRIESLLNLTGLSNRMISTFDELGRYKDVIHYDRIESILNDERRKSYDFLHDHLKN